jgi:hypothetical protein
MDRVSLSILVPFLFVEVTGPMSFLGIVTKLVLFGRAIDATRTFLATIVVGVALYLLAAEARST